MAPVYSPSDYSKMIELYCVTNKNARAAAALYADNHSGNPDNSGSSSNPDHKTIAAAWKRLQETGSALPGKKSTGPRTASDEIHEELVLLHVAENPHTSTRKVAQELDISHMTV